MPTTLSSSRCGAGLRSPPSAPSGQCSNGHGEDPMWKWIASGMTLYAVWLFLLPKKNRDGKRYDERTGIMPNLLVRPNGKQGRVTHVTPESAGWTYVGFDLYRLKPGEAAEAATGDREACLVFVSGKGRAAADGQDFGELGERMSPFDGKPWSALCPGRVKLESDGQHRSRTCRLHRARRTEKPSGARHRTRRSRPGDTRQGDQCPPCHQYPARDRYRSRFAAGGGSDHAGRPYLVLSAAQA